MAIHSFLGIEIGVPAPGALADAYAAIGLVGREDCWGTHDCPDQIRLTEAPYRRLDAMRLGCDDEHDLVRLDDRLRALGIDPERGRG